MAELPPEPLTKLDVADDAGSQTAVFAGGCFWCVEGVFEIIPGVTDVTSGYAGGDASTANYEATCRGDTGHAEVIRVTYDPAEVSFETLVQVFFGVAHDPTQLNRQGADRGTQYRSAFFYANEQQREVVSAYVKQLDDAGYFDQPIATTIEPLTEFFEAEPYHQDFARRNPSQPYVACTALPKIDKMRALLASAG